MSDKKDKPYQPAGDASSGTRLLPRITVQAFCENSQTAQLIESTLMDRRMSKVALTTHNGGLEGAVETYRASPTPNLLMIETMLPPDQIPDALEQLAEFCDPGTRVIVLGHVNDVLLYRQLIRSGVSEYVVLPSTAGTLVSAISDLFASEDADPIGRTIGFLSAKGGSGASTTAHNTAWAIAQSLRQQVLIVDMDMAFGTAGLNFNQDPPFGIADAVFAHEKLDAVMLDRLISKAANNINLLAAPGTLEQTYDFSEDAFEQIVEIVQSTIPMIVLDIPHLWSGWVQRTLLTLDEIVIVAEPDLANLRNAKSIVDTLKSMRPNEGSPLLVLNKVGLPKRPEISPAEFATAIDCPLVGQIPFEAALFGTAANNGQMIAEVSSGNKTNEAFRIISDWVTGRGGAETQEASTGLGLSSLMKMLKRA
jgi:pilus assembly protein CpaE